MARASCVGEVRSALQGFSGGVQRNARPEPEGILRLAAQLRQLPDCNDTRVLAEYRRILGLQDEPEAAKALRDELNVAHAREVLGEDLAALARVEDIVGEAQGPGFERVRAQAAYRRGRVLDAMGNTSGARQSLEEAVRLAKQTHAHMLGAMASLYLAKLLADDPTGVSPRPRYAGAWPPSVAGSRG